MATTECVCSGWLLKGRDILVMPVEACSGQNFATSNIHFATVKIKFHSNFISSLLHNRYFSRCLPITRPMCKFFRLPRELLTNWFFVCLLMLLFNGLGIHLWFHDALGTFFISCEFNPSNRSSIFCSLHHKKYHKDLSLSRSHHQACLQIVSQKHNLSRRWTSGECSCQF